MSDQTAARHSALTLAVQLAGIKLDPIGLTYLKDKDIMGLAETFLAFLNGADAPPKANAADATPVAKSAMPTAAKVAAKTPAPKPTKAVDTAASEGVESDGPTAEDVGKMINELLAADKQPEALAALKKYGAKSKSTLPVEHYADFIADAVKILMDA